MTLPSLKNHPIIKNSTNNRVAIFGAFDIIHPGHLYLINQALSLGKVSLVLARDKTITKMKGKEPYHKENSRLKNLKKIYPQLNILLGQENNPYEILDSIKPNIILLGPDQKIFIEHLHEELAKRKITAIIKRGSGFQLDYFKSSKIRAALENPQAGFLLINKEPGLSSHKVVSNLRQICQTKNIGHAGTLDPLAQGLLICGLEQSKKQLAWWQLLSKTYEVELELGKTSDTYDSEGIIQKNEIKKITYSRFEKVLKKYLGKQNQIPPPFSAKKIKGKKAYQLARAGKEVKLKPASIHIEEIVIQKFDFPTAKLQVKCSSGTYIRSLVHNIGQDLKAGAIMTNLKRTCTGWLNVNQALKLSELNYDNYQQNLYPTNKLLTHLNKIFIENPEVLLDK